MGAIVRRDQKYVAPPDRDEVRMGHVEDPPIRQPKIEGPEVVVQSFSDFVGLLHGILVGRAAPAVKHQGGRLNL